MSTGEWNPTQKVGLGQFTEWSEAREAMAAEDRGVRLHLVERWR